MKVGETNHLCRRDDPEWLLDVAALHLLKSGLTLPFSRPAGKTAMAKRFQDGLFSGPLDGRDAWYSSTVWDHFIG